MLQKQWTKTELIGGYQGLGEGERGSECSWEQGFPFGMGMFWNYIEMAFCYCEYTQGH